MQHQALEDRRTMGAEVSFPGSVPIVCLADGRHASSRNLWSGSIFKKLRTAAVAAAVFVLVGSRFGGVADGTKGSSAATDSPAVTAADWRPGDVRTVPHSVHGGSFGEGKLPGSPPPVSLAHRH